MHHQPVAFHMRDLRCFAGYHRVELRPLTLIYGRNNVGKSVLVRSLPLLADTLIGSEPLALSSPAARGASFRGMQCNLDESRPSIGLGLEWNDGFCRQVDYTWVGVGPTDRVPVPAVERCRFVDSREQEAVFERLPGRKQGNVPTEYRLSHGDGPPATFPASVSESPMSLVRDLPDGPYVTHLATWERVLRGWAKSVTWLAAERRPDISRPVQPTGYSARSLESSGANVLNILAEHVEIQKCVSDFYHQLVGRRLEYIELAGGGYYEFVLRSERPRLDVPLTALGQGLIQMLPVMTALAMTYHTPAYQAANVPSMLVIEEPESHQHGDLQEKLGQLIGQLVAGRPEHRLVIETHSEVLLLTIQLMIAQGELPPEWVLMHWVRQAPDGTTSAERVEFDADARPDGNLPRRLFSEDTDLLRRIHEARIARRERRA